MKSGRRRGRTEGSGEEEAAYQDFKLLRQVWTGFLSCFERHVAVETVALDVVWDPDDCCFGHAGVLGLKEGGKGVGRKR